MSIIFENKKRRKMRHRIEDLITEYGRKPTIDEIKAEFKKKGYKRPIDIVIVRILDGPGEGNIYYELFGGPGKFSRQQIRKFEEHRGGPYCLE